MIRYLSDILEDVSWGVSSIAEDAHDRGYIFIEAIKDIIKLGISDIEVLRKENPKEVQSFELISLKLEEMGYSPPTLEEIIASNVDIDDDYYISYC